ncbi:Hsp70 family protein [Devriesea agamarum]|uniref:Hsp70 family protein n=1 Tax=Devriesea agamarum TaxID=472569 RepID=UPI00071D902F|nr:Hsp70 family protein [Devriesea agamarum]
MRLGIDLGTTRTVVAAVDRGNYPVVTFEDVSGDVFDYVPSVLAYDGSHLVAGFHAMHAAESGSVVKRSIKRELASPDVTPLTPVAIGDRQVPIVEALTVYLREVHRLLLTSSSVSEDLAHHIASDENVDGLIGPITIAVPAHAHSAQRFITLDAFRRAGFNVSAMLHEPSAAGFEYTHRHGGTVTSRRTKVLVYDLGGGTFDASLVAARGAEHEVLGSLGDNRLGGDDFDGAIRDLALHRANLSLTDLSPAAAEQLLNDARAEKERVQPQTRRLVLDIATGVDVGSNTDTVPTSQTDLASKVVPAPKNGLAPTNAPTQVTLPIRDVERAISPLIDKTLDVMAPLVDDLGTSDDSVAGISVVGGASSFPLIPRRLRERFGRRVRRSPHPAASTAIGLAIAADPTAPYHLTDRLSRSFGVFREADDGSVLSFDTILSRDTHLIPGTDTTITRRYRSAHNIAVFRYVECTQITEDGYPAGCVFPFGHVLFPLTPELQNAEADGTDLQQYEVHRLSPEDESAGDLIEERYRLDGHGVIDVEIIDFDTGYRKAISLTTKQNSSDLASES